MKTVRCFDDLSPYGIKCLTGEACGLMMRVLCDFTKSGQRILSQTFGFEVKGGEPWNVGTKEDPHIGSIMLTVDMIPTLGVFALLAWACKEAYLIVPRTGIGDVARSLRNCLKITEAYARNLAEKAPSPQNDLLLQQAKALACSVGSYSLYSPGVVYGIEHRDQPEEVQEWLEWVLKDGWSARRFAAEGTAPGGYRNEHVGSGRIE